MAVLTKPTIKPTGATAGAIVTDVDLATMDEATAQLIKDAFLEYGLLIFPGQHLTSEAQARFGLRFGKLEFSSDTEPKAVPISNRKADGSLVGGDGPHAKHYLPKNPDAIHWLELPVKTAGGQFATVSLIRRIDTTGGLVLADGRRRAAPDAAGIDAGVEAFPAVVALGIGRERHGQQGRRREGRDTGRDTGRFHVCTPQQV